MSLAQLAQPTVQDSANIDALRNAALNTSRISGLTHSYYNYPARFSPYFVREAIQSFSEPGDIVLDPFCGGGTTLVEAMALGRQAVGIDISSLSTFVSKTKTILISDSDQAAVLRWAGRLSSVINIHEPSQSNEFYEEKGYYRNVSSQPYWRIKKAIDQAAYSISRIRLQNAKSLARCILLKSSQWALDSRKTVPSVAHFREKILTETDNFLKSALEFREAVYATRKRGIVTPKIENAPIADVTYKQLALKKKPRLVVTSPPYPGVHVLYHRWQVDGRKETPLPFMIADCLDGAGISYYAMGDRKAPNQKPYFANIEKAFRSIHSLVDEGAIVIQMIAFSQPEWQLDKYLEIMDRCGFEELNPWTKLASDQDDRLWRNVPNRKWHANIKGRTSSSKEVVLIHAAR